MDLTILLLSLTGMPTVSTFFFVLTLLFSSLGQHIYRNALSYYLGQIPPTCLCLLRLKLISISMLSKLDALISNILRPLNTDQTFMFTFPTCERPNLTAKNISYRIVPCNCHSPNKGPPPNFDSSVVCEAQVPAQLCGYPGKTWLRCIWCAIVESVFCQYTVRSHVFTSGPCDMSTNDSK